MNLVREEWIDISPAKKATKGFSVFPGVLGVFFSQNRGKQINNVSFWFSFNFLSLLSCCWPFCQHALPLSYWCPKQFIKRNAKVDIWLSDTLKSATCHLPFMWPLGPPQPLPSYAALSIPCPSINLFFFAFFPILSQSRPEDLTFKWQLFPDLFRNMCPCLGLPTGTRSEALCPAERASRWNSNMDVSSGNMTNVGL